MDRSRSKRSYTYDHDSGSQTPPPRSKHRRHHPYPSSAPNHRRRHPPPPPPPSSKAHDSPPPPTPVSAGAGPTTVFRILCPEAKAAAVIGKSGAAIKSIRSETGAWITVHEPLPGDEELVIEASDSRRRDPDGRPPQFSPAEDAMVLIHERIVDAELDYGGAEEGEYGGGGWGGGERERGRGRMTTRMVVPRGHVGCLLGKGGKIIEQMRMETKTHIRILPRDDYTPQCVSMSEEIVQIVGEGYAVKKAVVVICSRLKESLHRDRGPFRGRVHSPEFYLPPDDEFVGSMHGRSIEGSDLGSRSSTGLSRARNKLLGPQQDGYAFDIDDNPTTDCLQTVPCEDIVFRILCPSDRIEKVTGVSDGILEMLQAEVGVDVKVSDPFPGSDELIIVITSEEGPDAELFPAQEALLHIQTCIVDLGPDKDNIITTRLLVPAREIGCLEGNDGTLSDIWKSTSANVQILPKEDHPPCALEADELVQIVGEIKAARNALVHVTEKLRSYLYHDTFVQKDMLSPSVSASGHNESAAVAELKSPIRSSSREGYQGNDPPSTTYQNLHAATVTWRSKDSGGGGSGSIGLVESNTIEEVRKSALKSFSGPLVTRTTLEVIIPDHAVPGLTVRSGSKLAQISEMSGASVGFIEDGSDQNQKVVKISGSPEQAERAQNLLQGFILHTQDTFL